MTGKKAAKKAVVRRAAGTALVLVLALAVAGPVAAGKKPPPPTGDKTPPTTPTNLRATSLGQTSVTLAWDASTDNSGRFTYSVNKDGQSFTVPQGQTSYTIDWLSAGRTYTFYVTAVDNSLNTSGKSNILTVTTLADTAAPPAPTLSGHVRGPSQVRLTWNRVEDDTVGVRGLPHPRRRRPGHPAPELVRRDGRRSPAPHAGDDVHLHRSRRTTPAATRRRATRSR